MSVLRNDALIVQLTSPTKHLNHSASAAVGIGREAVCKLIVHPLCLVLFRWVLQQRTPAFSIQQQQTECRV